MASIAGSSIVRSVVPTAAIRCNAADEAAPVSSKLRRLVRDGIRLCKRADFTPLRDGNRIRLIDRRLTEMAQWQGPDSRVVYGDADTLRLVKRLRKHLDQLLTFLDKPEVPYENNLAERLIRPAVIIRKTSQSNRSEQGAVMQAILISVYRTLRLRGHDPIQTIAQAMRNYVPSGKLPPLLQPVSANG